MGHHYRPYGHVKDKRFYQQVYSNKFDNLDKWISWKIQITQTGRENIEILTRYIPKKKWIHSMNFLSK